MLDRCGDHSGRHETAPAGVLYCDGCKNECDCLPSFGYDFCDMETENANISSSDISIPPTLLSADAAPIVDAMSDAPLTVDHTGNLINGDERLSLILNSVKDAVFLLSVEAGGQYRFQFVNTQFLLATGLTAEQVIGKLVTDVIPEASHELVLSRYSEAIGSHRAIEWQETSVYPSGERIGEVRVIPVFDGEGRAVSLLGTVYDITSRIHAQAEMERLLAQAEQRAEREALLNRISEALRANTDPESIQQAAVSAVGEFLHVDRCYFSLYDLEADSRWVGNDFRRADLPALAGYYRISDYQVKPQDYYPTERTLIISDTGSDQWNLPGALLAALRYLRIRSVISVPIYHDGALVATFAVAMADETRIWTEDEVRLTEAVAALTRSTIEASRLLAEQQAHLNEEALVGRIGAAIRTELEPRAIQEKAAALVGEALAVDRCFYLTCDLSKGAATIGRDYHRPDLSSLAGEYRDPEFHEMLSELLANGGTLAVADVTAALSPNAANSLLAFQHRAILAVPFFDGEVLVAALWASMTERHVWTKHETALIEQAATLTRTALETARNSRKERTIAKQLQDALQPATPDRIPGMAIGTYTQPALDEASVGGDFMDVFVLDGDQYAIVIGDVSGKGLAAAQQLALIRNTLRTVLYLYRAPAQAASTLNSIVTSHGLLAGFVTAFVGVYDAGTARITYCSCGHEPGMVRRTGGSVEALENTGPPLGMAEDAIYTDATVEMSAGDDLLLYTDGLSEAGPNRIDLLGTAGLMELFSRLPEAASAQAKAEQLAANANAFASGAFRDDVAVLLLSREDSN